MKGHSEGLAYGVPNNVTTTATRNHNSTLHQHLQPRPLSPKSKKNLAPALLAGGSMAWSFSFVAVRNARDSIGIGPR